jgi:hypothetical protein
MGKLREIRTRKTGIRISGVIKSMQIARACRPLRSNILQAITFMRLDRLDPSS